jgi:hypothetical protein
MERASICPELGPRFPTRPARSSLLAVRGVDQFRERSGWRNAPWRPKSHRSQPDEVRSATWACAGTLGNDGEVVVRLGSVESAGRRSSQLRPQFQPRVGWSPTAGVSYLLNVRDSLPVVYPCAVTMITDCGGAVNPLPRSQREREVSPEEVQISIVPHPDSGKPDPVRLT